MTSLNARLVARLWDFCAPDKPSKWESTRYTYLHDPYVVDGYITATDAYKAILIDTKINLDTASIPVKGLVMGVRK